MERFRKEHAAMDVNLCDSASDVADGCDALVLVTEWNEYRDLEWDVIAKRMRSPFVLDGRHALDREKLSRAGLRYSTLN
jgi:UDPglucose 6-dehydrogenase